MMRNLAALLQTLDLNGARAASSSSHLLSSP